MPTDLYQHGKDTEKGFKVIEKSPSHSRPAMSMSKYAPKGTQMMYAEPFSAFGNGGGKSWNGIDPQSTFGYESEMIIQRGAYYRITKIEKSNGTIYIDLEVHPEKGYEFVEDMPGYKGSR